MRLPLRHPPPDTDEPVRRCAHLEALVGASTGLSLRAAATRLSAGRSRGRHGNALQWHLGLEPHDGEASLDWEDRIEIKLVSLWRNSTGRILADKLKVCDVGIDPWHKLSNVVFVFADRISRVIVGHRFWSLAGQAREDLARAWNHDPHFDSPELFVEAREQGDRAAPAYYLSANWLESQGLRPDRSGVLPFDGRAWSGLRKGGRDPLLTVSGDGSGVARCPRCGGRIHHDAGLLARTGWSPGTHAMPLAGECAVRGQVVVSVRALPPPTGPFSGQEQLDALQGVGEVVRLSDRIAEPEDHLH